jgi:ABC-2 type transport system ATP-binding protein
MSAIVTVRSLSKWYGKVIGLNNFNIDIGKGITGIVGPNGSGKSTFFKLLTGNIKANTGHISVFGEDPWKNPAQLMRIGFCPDYDFLPGELTGREYLRFVGGIHAMEGNELSTRTDEVLGIVNMKEAADRRMGGYSKGMRQRLKIAGCLLHDPPLLLLDEPLTGTDPVARKDLIDLILKLHEDHGHDIIVSSHVLHEVERLTRDIAIIYKGRAVATGDLTEIRMLMSGHPHNIIIEGQGLNALAKLLIDQRYTVSVEMSKSREGLKIQVDDPEQFFDSLPRLIKESGCEPQTVHSLDDNLESVFKYLVG